MCEGAVAFGVGFAAGVIATGAVLYIASPVIAARVAKRATERLARNTLQLPPTLASAVSRAVAPLVEEAVQDALSP